jgi:5-methyltetrahydropteroyltriglutamate--homocysteine methyltransferase
MLRSADRILTTHTGSLPRPRALREAFAQHEDTGAVIDSAQVRDAVGEVVRSQRNARVDVVNDGEMSKVGYSTYVKERLTGFDGESGRLAIHDLEDHPGLFEQVMGQAGMGLRLPAATGEVRSRGTEAVHADIANLKAATADSGAAGVFMTAASPGVIAVFLANQHYPSHEAYVGALAEAMKPEYDAIHQAGLMLQLDCPDLAMSRQMFDRQESFADFQRRTAQNVEALNAALADIPAESVRLHLCWGNYPGPHYYDVPLRDVLTTALRARATAFSFEGANPRHEHEWRVFEEVSLPEEAVILPGVIDSTVNYVEHPELVAQRLLRYANLVGRERVLASSDCGFATFSDRRRVHPEVAWAKLQAMAEGAELASGQLW